jgi:hypothetical protein
MQFYRDRILRDLFTIFHIALDSIFLFLSFCWVVATCIVGVFMDMLVDKELAEEERK